MEDINIGESIHDFGFDMLNNAPTEALVDIDISDLESAPEEWNFYRPLNDDKMEELLDSILNNGLLVPIIVWELKNKLEGKKYMILSGHNRKKAYEMLKAITGDIKYNSIPALIKKYDELTDDEAREIIIDTNWVQRVLSPLEKARSVIEKYTVLQNKSKYDSKKNKYGKGLLRDILGKQYNITGRQVDNYRSLDNLINEIQNLVKEDKVSITSASEVSKLNHNIQQWIFNNHPDKIKIRYTRKLKSSMDLGDVKQIFENNKEKKINTIKLNLPNEVFVKYKKLDSAVKLQLEKEIINLIKLYNI